MHMFLDDFKREVTRGRHLWRLSEDRNPQTLVEKLDYTNAELYPGIYVGHDDASDISCVNLRRRSGMKRLQMAFRNTMSDERLPSLAVLRLHKDKEVDRHRPSYLRVCWEERSKTIPVLINIVTCNTP